MKSELRFKTRSGGIEMFSFCKQLGKIIQLYICWHYFLKIKKFT